MRGTYTDNLHGELGYKSFKPDSLPPNPPLSIDGRMTELLGLASRHVAELDTLAGCIPNADLFISMYVRKEALLSSQIEGTQCTLDDILDPSLDASFNADVEEVVNYVRATHEAVKLRGRLPLCNRLLKKVHAILLEGARGEERHPGEFRSSQNWIGPSGCSLKQARYVPPNVEDMVVCMENLELFMNEPYTYDPLIKAALIHYQFETIHPFLDGNGRVGRLLIILFLMDTGVISKPVLYVSYFLKRNQVEYYDRLSDARRTGNLEQWVGFFLEAVDAAAVDASDAARKLVDLHNANVLLLAKRGKQMEKTELLISYLEAHPIVRISDVGQGLGVSYNTAANYVSALEEAGILLETTGGKRSRIFAYEGYLNILRKDT